MSVCWMVPSGNFTWLVGTSPIWFHDYPAIHFPIVSHYKFGFSSRTCLVTRGQYLWQYPMIASFVWGANILVKWWILGYFYFWILLEKPIWQWVFHSWHPGVGNTMGFLMGESSRFNSKVLPRWCTLWETNKRAIEHGHLQWVFPLKMVIFHSYAGRGCGWQMGSTRRNVESCHSSVGLWGGMVTYMVNKHSYWKLPFIVDWFTH